MIRRFQLSARRFLKTTTHRGYPVLELTFPQSVKKSVYNDSLSKNTPQPSQFDAQLKLEASSTKSNCTGIEQSSIPYKNIIAIPKPDGSTLLDRIDRRRVSVTGLIPKYCEVRFYYDTVFGVRHESKHLERGTHIHEVLERLQNSHIEEVLRIPESIPLEYANMDRVFDSIVKVLELIRNGSVRELYLQGMLPYGEKDEKKTVFVSGIIDKLHLGDNSQVVVTDTKTRASKTTIPTPESVQNAKYQTFIYRQMLDDLVSGRFNQKAWDEHHSNTDIDLVDFPIELASVVREQLVKTQTLMVFDKAQINNLAQLNFLIQKYEGAQSCASFQNLLNDLFRLLVPPVSEKTEVEFMYKNVRKNEICTISHHDFMFDRRLMNEVVEFSMSFWDYERPPLGVQNNQYMRCKGCHWKDQCEWKFKLDQNLM